MSKKSGAEKLSGAELRAAEEISGWLQKIQSCPEFRPSPEEFEDPAAYIRNLDPKGRPYGMCKIIPPPNFASNGVTLPEKLEVRRQPLKAARANEHIAYKPCHRKWTRGSFQKFAVKFQNAQHSNDPERQFWYEMLECRDKSVRYALDNPGVRSKGSGPLPTSPWDPKVLPVSPPFLFNHLRTQLPGVTEPMLYIAMLYSHFAWHTEDHDVSSVSFLHQGANKIWYGTPASAALDLERAVAKYLDIPLNGEGHEEVRRLLLKKATMIPPNVLMAAGVPVCRAIQQPGEFIVTFSRSYHAGFSVGSNVSEAVNYALPFWFQYGDICGRRYQLLRQPQVLPFQRILCMEAEALYLKLGKANAATSCHPASQDLHTMANFVRLMRGKYQQLRELRSTKNLDIEVAVFLEERPPVCNLCFNVDHVATLRCLCKDGIYTCLDHGNDARACGCSAGQAIVVASNLDRLVRIAGSFEKRPGVEERVSADVAAERSRPEFMDFWENEEGGWLQTELAGRTEEGQSGGAATEQWAPILGCSADKVWAELQSLLKQGAPQSSGEQGQHSNPGTRRTLACDGASEEPGSPSDAHKEPAPTVAPIVTSKHLPSLTPLTASQPASLVLPSEAVLIEKLGGLGTGEGVGGQPVVGAHAQGGTDWTAADSVFYPGDETDWAMIEEGEVGRGQKRMWDGAGLDGSSEERAQKKRGSDGREGAGEEGKERRSVTELQRELTQTQRLLHETEAALKEAKARAEVLEKALGDKEVAVEEASARAELFERAFHEQRGIVRKAELAAAQARETAVGRAKETAEVRSLSGTGVGRSVQVSAPVTRGQPVGGVEAAADVASSRVRPGSKPAVDNVREARAEPVTVARRPAGEAAVGGTGGGHTPWVEHQGGAQRTRRTEAGVAEGRGGGATQGGRHAWIPRGDRRGQGNKR